ncbi:MAG: NTP transferase domain-containing protein [Deltaproteobacteria bacterium]|nr:NTP transferase domain-containing protein [Deltaproteobacteria bacterium]
MKAVLLAGGFGTRIQPLTHSVPKPMVPLLNRPLMEHILGRLRDVGIRDVVVLLYHMPDVIRGYFGDGSRLGMNLEYVLPDDDYGTAGAVKFVQDLIDSTFVIISGDLVTDFDLGKILAFHQSKRPPVTITLTSVPNPLQFGVVITDADGGILRFLEKPGWGEVFSDTVNTGIYVLEPSIFSYIPAGRPFDFSKDLFPIFLREGTPIYGYNAKGYWRDVGDPDSYREASREVLEGTVALAFPGEARELDGGTVWQEDDAPLPADLRVRGRVVLGRGVTLGAGVTLDNAVLGDGCSVGDGAHLQNTVLWARVSVGGGARLRDAVLCDGVTLGEGVKIEKGGIVAEGTEVGDQATFEKDIMVWPDKKIEAGSVISANLVWGDKWKKAVFEGGTVRGRTNVELSPEFAAKMGAALGSVLPRESAILVGRDYLRASRMLKRAFLGGILSTGVHVHDIKMTPVPVERYKLASFGEVAGVYFQQSAAGPRHTEIIFYDDDGNVVDTNLEKSIERLFFKENFRRVDHSEVGSIQEMNAVSEFYREGYLRALDGEAIRSRRYRVVLDLGNGTTGDYLPTLLNSLGCQTVVLNAYPDERRLMRRSSEVSEALRQVGQIVRALDADVGFCVSPGGESLQLVDDQGVVRSHHETLLLALKLLAAGGAAGAGQAFLPVYAPRVLDQEVSGVLRITRGKTTSLKTSRMHEFAFIHEAEGCYAFPWFLHAPDALFTVAKLLELLSKAGKRVSDVLREVPPYAYEKLELPCPVDRKGLAMRRMSEDSVDKEAAFVDGVQVFLGDRSVLLLPDAHRPCLHLVVEGADRGGVDRLVSEYREKIGTWIGA